MGTSDSYLALIGQDLGLVPKADQYNIGLGSDVPSYLSQAKDLVPDEHFDMTKFMNELNPYISAGSKFVTGISSLGSLYLGFKQLDMAKDALSIAKEKWAMTKDELNRIKQTRDRLTKSYMGD